MRTTSRYSWHMRAMIWPGQLYSPSWRRRSRSMAWNSCCLASTSKGKGRRAEGFGVAGGGRRAPGGEEGGFGGVAPLVGGVVGGGGRVCGGGGGGGGGLGALAM